MVADAIEMIFIDHISHFVKLNASFLRVNFGFPTDVDHDNAFVCGVDDKCYRQCNAPGRSKYNRNFLESEMNSINQPNEP